MAFDLESRILGGQWVYHNELEQVHPTLYHSALGSIGKIESTNQLGVAAANLRALAAAEAAKERALIEKIFGTSVGLDPMSPNFYAELIKGLNYALSSRQIFERMINRIKAGETQISIAALMGSYIGTAIVDAVDEMDPAAKIKSMMLANSRLDFNTAANEVMSDLLDKAFERGIERALNSADFRGGEDRGYQELIQYLSDNAGSAFIAQLKKIWHLEELKQQIIDSMKKYSINKRNKVVKKQAKEKINTNMWQRGGLTLEAISAYVMNAIGGISGSNFQLSAEVIGDTGGKADTIATFGMDIDATEVGRIFDENLEGSVSRERNIAAMQAVVDRLSGINDGFIIYTSAKNYSLSKNFNGFSSGEGVNLNTYAAVMSGTGSIDSLVGAVMNTIPGTIGEGTKAYLEKVIATDIANMLFDDVETIGYQSGGANAIHLMYLNGIYVPLSFLLNELANAIESIAANPNQFVNATISAPASLKVQPPENTGMPNWHRQAVLAKDGIVIKMRFLSNFSAIINSLFG